MDKSSKLIPSKIKSQCDSAIKMLTEDNNKLIDVSNSIDIFVNDRAIESSAFNSLKDQMSNFKYAINMMQSANDADIEAYRVLSNMVGTEELDGAILLEQLEEAQRSKKESEEKIAGYKTILSGVGISGAMNSYNNNAVNNYEQLIEADNAIIKEIQGKIDFYDSVDASSAGLFAHGQALRTAALSAMGEINKSAISNNSYLVENPQVVQGVVMSGLSLPGVSAGSGGQTQGKGEFITEYNYFKSKSGRKVEFDLKKKEAYAKYKAEFDYSGLYNGYKYNNDYVNATIGHSISNIDGEFQTKASLYDKNGNLSPEAKISAGVELSMYEIRGDAKIGNDDIYSKTKVEGDVVVVEAKGTAGFELDEDGSGYDVELGGELEASAFSGEVKQTFGLFGYEVEITAEGKLAAAGVEGKVAYDSGTFEAKAGVSAGAGASIGIKVGKVIPEEEILEINDIPK